MSTTGHTMRAPRWFVIIDPKGAANLVSDMEPGPLAVVPGLMLAGNGDGEGWYTADSPPVVREWADAVAIMNAHNGQRGAPMPGGGRAP